jgi:hypothetical protein
MDLFKGCACCVRPGEHGTIHIAADGNMATFRRSGPSAVLHPDVSHFILDRAIIDAITKVNNDVITVKGCNGKWTATTNDRKAKSVDETGLFGVCCARTGTLLVACDMITGERYIYPDLVLATVLHPFTKTGGVDAILYYDVGCRYASHIAKPDSFIQKRLPEIPIRVAIGKMHVWAHGSQCVEKFHPSNVDGCGLTDGEAMERHWAGVSKFQRVIKEMTRRRRRETLEDVFLMQWHACQDDLAMTLHLKLEKAKEVLKLLDIEQHHEGGPERRQQAATPPATPKSKIPAILQFDAQLECTYREMQYFYWLVNRRFTQGMDGV